MGFQTDLGIDSHTDLGMGFRSGPGIDFHIDLRMWFQSGLEIDFNPRAEDVFSERICPLGHFSRSGYSQLDGLAHDQSAAQHLEGAAHYGDME